MSAKKPSNGAKQNANSATNAAAGGAQQTARPQSRSRRETSAQLMGRNSRNSAGLRSASLAADAFPQSLEPPPYIVTDEYILKRYAGNPPSLIVHMHATHFKFDQQDGVFPYKSPMKLFLEHLRARTVPHEILIQLTQAGVTFMRDAL
ncbi:unnamed protein product [Parascedosporium putredinis]|uniref:Spt20-like SEP domain-containing protein n=1 Tax=Parascedosporium putredinis TaxID=1442378 RepID=A0A9P1GXS6_9PEZI|nr:unnamed protein product [Parascedosporium putredinis]CAI7989334.1 unnamed protein product [Parascedosporium putredinis]